MEKGEERGGRLQFGEVVLDLDRGALLRGDEEIRLRPQSFRVLKHLAENRGRLVSRNELLDAIWGPKVVTDGALTQCLIEIRRALGDDSRQLIRTVPKRGYVFEATGSERAPASLRRFPFLAPGRRLPAVGAAVLLAVVTGWLLLRPSPDAAAPDSVRKSIAVLAFADMSEAQDQQHFSDGISEEILNTLAQSPYLRVTARTSSFSFKGRPVDIATIADTLDVAYVLEGSVRRTADRFRISAQLIDAGTSAHLWSTTYDRELTDVLDVQREIAASVADALKVTLSLSGKPGPANGEAYEAYLQGRFFHKRRAPGDRERAETYYRKALLLDPAHGRAWSGLAGVHTVQVIDEGNAGTTALAAWEEAVRLALRHAPELAEAHVRAATYYGYIGNDARAGEHRRRATTLGPENPLVLTTAASGNALAGRLDLAVEQYRRSVEADPLSAVDRANLASFLAAAGLLEESLAEEKKAVDLNPSRAPQYKIRAGYIFMLQGRTDDAMKMVDQWPEGPDRDAGLALIHHAHGRPAAAEAALEKLIARMQAEPGAHAALRVAEVHAFRGEPDESFRWLAAGRKLAQEGAPWDRIRRPLLVQLSPFLIPLRDDPRWDAVVAREPGRAGSGFDESAATAHQ